MYKKAQQKFDDTVIESRLKEELNEKVDEIFREYQDKLGIKSYDADPFIVVDLDEKEEALVGAIVEVLKDQYSTTNEI